MFEKVFEALRGICLSKFVSILVKTNGKGKNKTLPRGIKGCFELSGRADRDDFV
ncbi:MAG: hypothetical protein ACTSP1_19425 [Candidatus Freyarchaeota archaeon]